MVFVSCSYDVEDLRQIDPLSTEESLVAEQLLLKSLVVECFEDIDMITVAQNQSGLSVDVVVESSGTVGLESNEYNEKKAKESITSLNRLVYIQQDQRNPFVVPSSAETPFWSTEVTVYN